MDDDDDPRPEDVGDEWWDPPCRVCKKVDDEPNESLWTSEEFAEMQAATRAESERKRQAAWNLLNPTKRSRNS